uniref:Uncharacterized protein n=1 Tax=Cacopsylla melanoneura TaxID=428564 RepID=A0A8D8WHT2_9HEMI
MMMDEWSQKSKLATEKHGQLPGYSAQSVCLVVQRTRVRTRAAVEILSSILTFLNHQNVHTSHQFKHLNMSFQARRGVSVKTSFFRGAKIRFSCFSNKFFVPLLLHNLHKPHIFLHILNS